MRFFLAAVVCGHVDLGGDIDVDHVQWEQYAPATREQLESVGDTRMEGGGSINGKHVSAYVRVVRHGAIVLVVPLPQLRVPNLRHDHRAAAQLHSFRPPQVALVIVAGADADLDGHRGPPDGYPAR